MPLSPAPQRLLCCAFGLLSALALSGCGSARPSAYLDGGEQARDIARAERAYQVARAARSEDAPAAERALREAISADLYHGPAHNDLGVLLLQQGRIYDAAFEFTWARKLLPGHPEPRLNLAIALMQGEKTDEALAAAHSALEVRPGYLPATQALAMLSIRSKRTGPETDGLLADIIERSEEISWRDWAQRERIRLRNQP